MNEQGGFSISPEEFVQEFKDLREYLVSLSFSCEVSVRFNIEYEHIVSN